MGVWAWVTSLDRLAEWIQSFYREPIDLIMLGLALPIVSHFRIAPQLFWA